MDVVKIRNVLVKILLATLIAAAAVAVGVILVGSVDGIMGRVLWTVMSALFYIGILLAILSSVSHIGESTKSRSDLFVINSVLALTCASYITSILSIWTVIDGDLPWRMHAAYLVFLCGVAYAKPLIDLESTHSKLKNYVYTNYFFIALACVLLSIAICAPDSWGLWDNMFGRSIAATIVINVSLSMVITVLYHLDSQQHPKLHKEVQQTVAAPGQEAIAQLRDNTAPAPAAPAQPPRQRMSTAMIVVLTLLGIFVGMPIVMMLLAILVGLTGGW